MVHILGQEPPVDEKIHPLENKFRPYDDWHMHVYASMRSQRNACNYYRIEVPLRGMKKLELANSMIDKGDFHTNKEVADRYSLSSLLLSDVLLCYGMGETQGHSIVDTIRGMNAGMFNNRVVYPPSVVYDIDDNLDWVHPYNFTYSFYGVRTEQGPLKVGDTVWTKDGQGNPVPLWEDKVTTGEKNIVFDIGKNWEYNKRLHDFARAADGFTTPSPHLAKYMRDTHQYPEPYVFPNSIIPEDWLFREFAPRPKENIRIMWQGGGSHLSDWFHMVAPLRYIVRKYPNVTFVMFGELFPWVTDAIPPAQLEAHPWIPYDGYKPKRALMDCDINLCVLRDDEFSRSKSAVKFYEGSLGPNPEATLAPNMPPYAGEVVDGETGLLYDTGPTPEAMAESFVSNLEELIKNVELRKRIAANAQAWVLANRHYLKTVPGLYEYYYELRLKKMKDKPYDPEKDKLPAKPTRVSRPKAKVGKKK